MARYGIVVDLNRCTGCMTCVIACKQENLTRPGVRWNRVLEYESRSLGRILYFRHACMHCDRPPCIEACPEHAISKRQDGIVLIDHEKCRGHGDCVTACPYGVIDINPMQDYFQGERLPFEGISGSHRVHPPGKASTCTLCVHRIEQGKKPTCVEACPSRAMVFGDLDDPYDSIQEKLRGSEQLLPSSGTRPKVFYIFPKGMSKYEQSALSMVPSILQERPRTAREG
jgi:Fe-S-cluster-containing dehydrogenase component